VRVVIIGATGNVGTSVLDALSDATEVREIVAVLMKKLLDLRAGIEEDLPAA